MQVIIQSMTAGFTRGIDQANERLKTVRKSMQAFGQVMKMPVDQMNKLNGRMKVMQSRGGNLALTFRNLTHGARGFRMEMLGIMFFGMALTRIFSRLVGTSLDWMGTFEIMGAALGILFLPLAEFLTDIALKFLDWVSNLTEKQKKWLGILVLIIGIVGLVIGLIGTLALGIGSLILVFGGFGAVIAMMSLIGIVIVGLGLIVSGVVKLIQGKLEGIGLVIMGIGVILLLFIGWWALIPIAVGAAVFFVIKHWGKVKTWFSNFWGWIKDIFKKILSAGKKAFGFLNPFNLIGGNVLGSFQSGGIVPQTGPYLLHRGETVVPTNQTNANISPTINISANISSDYDVRRLAEELKRYWVSDFERVSQGRS